MTLDQRGDVCVVGPGEKIPFLMARDGAVLSLGRTLADRHHVDDPAMPPAGLRALSEAHLPPGAQMSHKLLLEHPARLDEETAIDRFVGYPHVWIVRILPLQPTRNLLRRPLQRQLLRHPPT